MSFAISTLYLPLLEPFKSRGMDRPHIIHMRNKKFICGYGLKTSCEENGAWIEG
jgi:hypothetical protein